MHQNRSILFLIIDAAFLGGNAIIIHTATQDESTSPMVTTPTRRIGDTPPVNTGWRNGTCTTEKSLEQSTAFLQKQESTLGDKPGDLVNSSNDYWEDRYEHGGNSGLGSYGKLAAYKADVLNKYVTEQSIHHVVELGFGDGNQLTLANYPSYTGLDVSTTVWNSTRLKFAGDASKEFLLYDGVTLPEGIQGELAISLDVLYHLVDMDVYQQYLDNLFSVSSKHVVIYASDTTQVIAKHMLSRAFTEYISLRYPCWHLASHLQKPKEFPRQGSFFVEFFMYKKEM